MITKVARIIQAERCSLIPLVQGSHRQRSLKCLIHGHCRSPHYPARRVLTKSWNDGQELPRWQLNRSSGSTVGSKGSLVDRVVYSPLMVREIDVVRRSQRQIVRDREMKKWLKEKSVIVTVVKVFHCNKMTIPFQEQSTTRAQFITTPNGNKKSQCNLLVVSAVSTTTCEHVCVSTSTSQQARTQSLHDNA